MRGWLRASWWLLAAGVLLILGVLLHDLAFPCILAEPSDAALLLGGFLALVVCGVGLFQAWRASSVLSTLDALREEDGPHLSADAIRQLREQRHDFHNQLTVLLALIQMGATDRAQAYIKQMFARQEASSTAGDLAPQAGHGEAAARSGPGTRQAPTGAPAPSGGKAAAEDEGQPDLTPLFAFMADAQRRAAEVGVRCYFSVRVAPDARQGADPDFMRILGNLVDNALDAASEAPPGQREVSVEAAWNSDGLRLQVANSGPVLTPEMMQLIFTPGFSTKRGRHQGLGLSVVQRLVTERQGRIEVDSSEEEGTRFLVILPSARNSLSLSRNP